MFRTAAMIRCVLWSAALALACGSTVGAQERAAALTEDGGKRATARRVPGGAIDLDGRLDEDAWQRGDPVRDFLQKEPTEGAEPTQPMEVWFLYDDTALYVGARMNSLSPAAIQAPLGRRDVANQAEHILISLDTFLDRRTAYAFGVTASGVRLDRFYPADDETDFTDGFDPVWEARTAVDASGWTAELWIPFSQLRFNERTEHVWGLNIQRFTPTGNENDYWVVVPRTQKGWSSHFGHLRGIDDLRPPRRLEILPYMAGTSVVHGTRTVNPFQSGAGLGTRIGADMKVGVGPNLTLDVAVNPDFGQVEADPAEVNLSVFPTRFAEKRPFFIEGSQVLSIAHQNAFYSRRIGARPSGPASGDYVDYPLASTILAAGKLTGRLGSGTSIGILSAVTDEESARTATIGFPHIGAVRVTPRAMYGVARVLQEFGPSASTAGLMINVVHRDLSQDDLLSPVLSRNAVVAAGDALLRFRGGEYELTLVGLGTLVNGDAAAIERIQRSSSHYMQRPDRDYATLDRTRTSLTGYSTITGLRRTSGRHWLWNVSAKIDSPGFETNDIGNLTGADSMAPTVELRYRETRPGTIFRNYSLLLRSTAEWSYGGERTRGTVTPTLQMTWLNFWTTSVAVGRNLRTRNVLLTRGGPAMGTPMGWTTDVNLANSTASKTRWSARIVAAETEDDGRTRRVNGTVAFQPGPQWELSVTPAFEHVIDTQQYVTTLGGGRPEMFGSRYIFAFIDRHTYSSQYRMGFTLRPDLNLDIYAEPFASSGRYFNYGELLRGGRRERLTYGASGTAVAVEPDGARVVTPESGASFTLRNDDFNIRSFRSNVALRWEWRPGSTLYVVWQQDRRGSQAFDTPAGPGDMFGSFTAPGPNYFVVKTTFWLPMN